VVAALGGWLYGSWQKHISCTRNLLGLGISTYGLVYALIGWC
jgi:hypothetical protein